MKLASLLGCVAAPGESSRGFAPQSYGGPFRTYKAQHSRESLHTGAKGSLKSIASHGLEGFAKSHSFVGCRHSVGSTIPLAGLRCNTCHFLGGFEMSFLIICH